MAEKRKLTLSVDGEVVRRAKRLAHQWDTSVSGLVEQSLRRLTAEGSEASGDEATPLVAELRGSLPEDADRAEHRRHLERKHGA